MEEPEHKFHIGGRSRLLIIKSGIFKYIMIFCFFMISLKASAPGTSVAVIFISQPVDAYERLVYAIVMVESAGDTLAINILEEAFGAFQIRPIRLLDYYQRTGTMYSVEDCLNYEISKEIFMYYARNTGHGNFQAIACNWNGSGTMTLVYWGKVKKYL